MHERVNNLLQGEKTGYRPPARASERQDQERKARIEKAAIRACCDYFENIGYNVKSVEKENLGWDLEATSDNSQLQLCIEVKGLSGNDFFVELTPNEYKFFRKQRDNYRLAVVTRALDDPQLHICRYSAEKSDWLIEGFDGSIVVQPKESASIKCVIRQPA
jgi:hypothetical protein